MQRLNRDMFARAMAFALVTATILGAGGCSTAPKVEDRETFVSEARAATKWFESNVSGLRGQIDKSAGYIIFPGVAQWGIIFMGGDFGRGMLCRPDGTQIGWAAVNTPSIGLQAGVRGFKMLLVLEDQGTLDQFMKDQLSGSVSGVVVVGESGDSGRAPFEDGVAVYQGASSGLMAGVNIGLDYVRYKPLGEE
ncbi:MAG: YSC84-related protein [Planctomycetota bacterium]|jgi:lipid-binding SYLF domain-containing protein